MDDPQVLLEAARQVDLSKIPLFHANTKKDVFTPEEWIDRVQRAKDAGTWNDATTTSYVYNALREGALTWYRSLNCSGVNNTIWAEVKTAFLKAYGTTHTSRTTTTTINDLKQGSHTVIDYYTKVVEAMTDLQALMPPNALGRPAVLYRPEIQAVDQFRAVPENIRVGCVDDHVKFGAQQMIYFVATQIFINGLNSDIRAEVMKANPVTIMDACTEAQTIEKINKSNKTVGASNLIASIDGANANPEEDDDLKHQIDELKRRHWAAKRTFNPSNGNGAARSGNGARGNSNGGYSGGNPNNNNNKRSNPAQGKKCHYCKKLNHFQKECRARLSAGAPMVPPPGRVAEQRPAGNDPDGRNCHPFSEGGQYDALDAIYNAYGPLN